MTETDPPLLPSSDILEKAEYERAAAFAANLPADPTSALVHYPVELGQKDITRTFDIAKSLARPSLPRHLGRYALGRLRMLDGFGSTQLTQESSATYADPDRQDGILRIADIVSLDRVPRFGNSAKVYRDEVIQIDAIMPQPADMNLGNATHFVDRLTLSLGPGEEKPKGRHSIHLLRLNSDNTFESLGSTGIFRAGLRSLAFLRRNPDLKGLKVDHLSKLERLKDIKATPLHTTATSDHKRS